MDDLFGKNIDAFVMMYDWLLPPRFFFWEGGKNKNWELSGKMHISMAKRELCVGIQIIQMCVRVCV